MSAPLAYLNGRWLPAAEAALPLDDAGFVQGVTVTEQLRTFGGRLFRLPQHLARLARSLQIVGIDPGVSCDELAKIAEQLTDLNHRLLPSGDDLGLSIFFTPGPYATLAGGRTARPTVGMHTYPLPFALWAGKYNAGQALVTTPIEQVAPRSWPPELKCRSRMHYYLADQQAREQDPAARALLLNDQGLITETATANVLLYHHHAGLISPPRESILPGISLEYVAELAVEMGIAFDYRPIAPNELLTADEVLLTSTPSCLLPVTRFNGQPIGPGVPGEVFRRLLARWSEAVGIDIAAQPQVTSAAASTPSQATGLT